MCISGGRMGNGLWLNISEIFRKSTTFLRILFWCWPVQVIESWDLCFQFVHPSVSQASRLNLKIAWIQMWRKIRFLLVIITLRFTCGERKKCNISNYSKMLCSGLKFLATYFRKVCLHKLLISFIVVYDSMKEKLTSF